ncbi:MAG: hypothetical protein AB1428_01700 [Bacteroidota bacterium]
MEPRCVKSCKGLCAALEVAERREQEGIRMYKEYADGCDYPDVKEILESLIRDREQAVKTLQEKRAILAVKFEMVERINESFA